MTGRDNVRSVADSAGGESIAFEEFRRADIEQSVPDRFEQQVRRFPDRLAVKSPTRALSYAALNTAANRLAHAIVERRGVGQEPVALLVEKDAALIVAMLGALKAGKIYVPLDPSLPPARFRQILSETRAGLVITTPRALSSSRELGCEDVPRLNLEELDPGLPGEDLDLRLSPEAYLRISYTSGSTGQPKGVVVTHGDMLHRTRHVTNTFRICADDRLALLGTWTTDILGVILNGAALFPVNLQQEGTARLAGWLEGEEITLYSSVPTAFRLFAGALAGNERFPRLRLIRLEGEPVQTRDVELFRQHFSPGCVLVNSFGITEAGPITSHVVGRDTRITENLVPVGFAGEDKEVLILDGDGQEAAPGEIGEIAVRSRYLAVGYWQQPELTRQKFLPNAPEPPDVPTFATDDSPVRPHALPPVRTYLTGDLGRLLPDGCLLYLGRKDSQVKIHGFRIELEEVEMALLDLDVFREVSVVARESDGAQRLVAYLVSASQPAPTVSALRRALAERVPDYMIPSAFVMLAELPRTVTGKLDRKALPPPGRERPALESPFEAPRTPLEEGLARLWANVLGLDQVGIHDPLWELGADSLRATQILSRVAALFDVQIPLQTLFEAPTVAELALRVLQSQIEELCPDEISGLFAGVDGHSDEEARRLAAGGPDAWQ
jgi:amino acid adenylation domain-containing protein